MHGHYLINVGNSTMTITTLILLLATGIVAVTAMDDCPSQYIPITNCCDLNSNYLFTFGRKAKVPSGIYSLVNFCQNSSVIAIAYCDNCNWRRMVSGPKETRWIC